MLKFLRDLESIKLKMDSLNGILTDWILLDVKSRLKIWQLRSIVITKRLNYIIFGETGSITEWKVMTIKQDLSKQFGILRQGIQE